MPPLIALASLSVLLYAVAAARYYPVWKRRRRALPASVITAFILLAEAMIALTFGRNWQATWWEWHLLYLVAFGIIAYTAHRQWREERFSDLYLEETRGQTREHGGTVDNLYEMLTGQVPHDAETPMGIAMMHIGGQLHPPTEANPDVPEEINAVTTRLLAREPENRYQGADELVEDLERVVQGQPPVFSTPQQRDEGPKKGRSPRRPSH